MPGYPTRKLLFGGPETLTNAAIVPRAHSSPPRGLRQDDSVVDRQSDTYDRSLVIIWGVLEMRECAASPWYCGPKARRHCISKKAQLCC